MGVIYTVACRDCGVSRDLDKFYSCHPVENRNRALELSADISKSPHAAFCAALLTSFMAAHTGHNCTVFTDSDEALSEELDPDLGGNTKPDGDFWGREQ